MARREREACAVAELLPLRPQRLNLDAEPLSRSSVSPFSLRLRDWSTWKTPAENRPGWALPFLLLAVRSATVPFRASTIERIGIERAVLSGAKLLPAPGTLMKTL